MRLHRVPTLAPRCGKGSRPRLGTEKPAYGATTAVPGCAVRRPAVQADIAGSWPDFQSRVGAREDRQGMGQRSRRGPYRSASQGPSAWRQCGVCGGLCLQGVPGAPARQNGKEPRIALIRMWSRQTQPPVINGKSSQPMSSAIAAIDGDNLSRRVELTDSNSAG